MPDMTTPLTSPEDRQPPQDLLAEQYVLGAVMQDKRALDSAIEVYHLTRDHFYHWKHQVLFDVVLYLDECGGHGRWDGARVAQELERRGQLERVGGTNYVFKLVEWPGSVSEYASKLRAQWKARGYVQGGGQMQQLGYSLADGADEDEVDERARAILEVATTPVAGRQVASRLLSGGDFILNEPDEVPALWGHRDLVLWPQGEGLMIAGQQGVGKTTIGQQLVLHMIGVRSGPFLGLHVAPADGRVLYLAMDRPRQAARSFHRMVTNDQRRILNERLTVWKGPLPINLVADRYAFARWCLRQCPDVSAVVVDSVKDLAAGISKDEIGSALNLAWQELIASEVDLMLLHHGRKAQQGAQRGKTIDDIYGSTWLTSGLGSVLLLDGDPGAELVNAYHVKQPAETVPDFVIRHDPARGVSLRHGDEVPSIEEQIADAGVRGLTAKEIAVVQEGSGKEAAVRKVKRRLEPFISKGSVRKEPGVHTGSGVEPTRYVSAAVRNSRLTLVDGEAG